MNKKNRKNKERQKKKENKKGEREAIERRGKHQALRINLLDFNSSVEVGYGFHAIRSKLLIANDMC